MGWVGLGWVTENGPTAVSAALSRPRDLYSIVSVRSLVARCIVLNMKLIQPTLGDCSVPILLHFYGSVKNQHGTDRISELRMRGACRAVAST